MKSSDFELEERNCSDKKCTNWFKVLPQDKQQYCSEYCRLENLGKKPLKELMRQRYAQKPFLPEAKIKGSKLE